MVSLRKLACGSLVLIAGCIQVTDKSAAGGDAGVVPRPDGGDSASTTTDGGALQAEASVVDSGAADGQGSGHRYQAVCGQQITWSAASLAAQAAGGHLASVTSAEENAVVFALVEPGAHPECWTLVRPGPWIGGTRISSVAPWQWSNGEPWAYTNWAKGQPDLDTENYVGFYDKADGWNNASDTSKAVGYVIEWD